MWISFLLSKKGFIFNFIYLFFSINSLILFIVSSYYFPSVLIILSEFLFLVLRIFLLTKTFFIYLSKIYGSWVSKGVERCRRHIAMAICRKLSGACTEMYLTRREIKPIFTYEGEICGSRYIDTRTIKHTNAMQRPFSWPLRDLIERHGSIDQYWTAVINNRSFLPIIMIGFWKRIAKKR